MNRNVLSYFEKSAKSYPDRIAVVDESVRYTYTEFMHRCMQIGTGIASHASPGSAIGLYLEKSADAVCAMLGAVYAGGCYSTLNVELPAPRLHQIASVLQPALIVTTDVLYENAAAIFSDFQIVTINQLLTAQIDIQKLSQIRMRRIDTDPLYINFTSGSTGVPKGIAVCHRSVIDFIDCFTEIFQITSQDIIANQAPFDFDVSVKDIYSAFSTGAALVVIPRYMFSSPVKLIDFLCEQKVTTMIWAVSALCLLTTFHALEYRVPETVSKILYSGEVMPYKALCAFQKYLPAAQIVNLYGPTEITCNCTYHILEQGRDYSQGVPIGKPFPNEDVFLLDSDNKQILEPEIIGEVCVRGTALALGYLSSPEQNMAHFVQNPLNNRYPERIYRTGDLARYNEAGELVFSGRKDFQIKYMGHRIELEEIERKMAAFDGIERCCCLFDEKRSRLIGVYVGTAQRETLIADMKKALPEYMIPGIIRQIEEMPLTKNGKIDRKALSELTARRRS